MNLEINRNGCISMENKFYLTREKIYLLPKETYMEKR